MGIFLRYFFFKNFVLFHPVLEKIFFWGGWEKFGLDFALFLVPIPPSKVGIPLTRLQNFKFLWVGRSFSGENWRKFFHLKMCFHTLGGGGPVGVNASLMNDQDQEISLTFVNCSHRVSQQTLLLIFIGF